MWKCVFAHVLQTRVRVAHCECALESSINFSFKVFKSLYARHTHAHAHTLNPRTAIYCCLRIKIIMIQLHAIWFWEPQYRAPAHTHKTHTHTGYTVYTHTTHNTHPMNTLTYTQGEHTHQHIHTVRTHTYKQGSTHTHYYAYTDLYTRQYLGLRFSKKKNPHTGGGRQYLGTVTLCAVWHRYAHQGLGFRDLGSGFRIRANRYTMCLCGTGV